MGFANKPNDGRYFNKRAETAFKCVQWIGRGGALSESANLLTALGHTQWTTAVRQGTKSLRSSPLRGGGSREAGSKPIG